MARGAAGKAGAASAAMLILLAATPVAADYQTGLDAYQAGDYATAMAEWKEEVNRPRVPTNLSVYREALYAIGMLYWQGEGVEQDYAVSAVWLKQAADINHPGAQNKLGYLYSTGQGVPQNYQQARRWFEMAAAQGDPDAVHNLDRMFQRGLFAGSEVAATGPRVQPDPVAGSEPVPEPDTAPAVESQQPTEAAVRTGVEPDSGQAEEPAPPAAVARDGEAGLDWIREQDPEHYTIQVVALRNVGKLQAFIAGHPEWQPFAIYTPAGNAKPLWVLVQGVYPDVKSARAAANKFPRGLQARDKLWIRKFRMVQAMLE